MKYLLCLSVLTLIGNEIIEHDRGFYARESIIAGNSVTTDLPYGDVVVKSGAKVTFSVGESLKLESGFKAETGSELIFTTHTETTCNAAKATTTASTSPASTITRPESQHSVEDDIFELITNTEKPYTFFPNPTRDKVYVSYNQYMESTMAIKVLDSMGNIVYQKSDCTRNTIINLADQPGGIYILNITCDNQSYTDKIIKE